MDTFGKRLKYLIKKSDIKTIKNFAKKAGLHEVSISNVLRGQNNPSYDVIEACVNCFSDAEIIWLLSGRDFKSKIELENKQLKEQVQFYEDKLEAAAKLSSNGISPQKPKHHVEYHQTRIFA